MIYCRRDAASVDPIGDEAGGGLTDQLQAGDEEVIGPLDRRGGRGLSVLGDPDDLVHRAEIILGAADDGFRPPILPGGHVRWR